MKKINALISSDRDKDCTHEMGFRYMGSVPCTGPLVCIMCGATKVTYAFSDPFRQMPFVKSDYYERYGLNFDRYKTY